MMSQLVAMLEQIPALNQSAMLMEKLADYYAAQGKPESAIDTYERALNLGPVPATTHPHQAHARREIELRRTARRMPSLIIKNFWLKPPIIPQGGQILLNWELGDLKQKTARDEHCY